MDNKAIEYHVRELLRAIGEDPDREGLRETPRRVAGMLNEMLEGISYSNHDIAKMFGKTFTQEGDSSADEAVVMKDITVFSFCEHHMALMYDMHVNVAYIPRGKVLGLSKIARICDMAAKRLQLQERLGRDIAQIISEAAGTEDVGVLISGCHSCMTARGIRNSQARTVTKTFMGKFREDPELKALVEDYKEGRA
ncbi:MAG: GTP cyclohydrolase I [Ruminococcus sp.]|nr:GTP cyclohydrolase I [Ruminococcus sp.]